MRRRTRADRMIPSTVLLLMMALFGVSSPEIAKAEVTEVRLDRQSGFNFLPLMVMEHEKLIEKHAASAGMPQLKVKWSQAVGAPAVIDALLSDAADFVVAGAPSLALVWDKTKGGKGDVHGVAAVGWTPLTLVSRNSEVKSIRDFTPKDRIAMQGLGTGIQAILLQMAAEKEWGAAAYTRLDPLMISMPHPDAMMAMLSGKGEVTAHFSGAPYDQIELSKKGFHKVLGSQDVLGSFSSTVMFAKKSFHDGNPKVYKVVLAALKDAADLINRDKEKAARIYLEQTREKLKLEDLVSILKNPKVVHKIQPENTFPLVEFLHRTGRIKNKPANWKDLYFPEIHELGGS